MLKAGQAKEVSWKGYGSMRNSLSPKIEILLASWFNIAQTHLSTQHSRFSFCVSSIVISVFNSKYDLPIEQIVNRQDG